MRLKSVTIKGLWGKQNLLWELNPNVNILTGSNGSGKSTIMDIIANVIINGYLPKDWVDKVNNVGIEFDNKQALMCLSFNDTLQKLKSEAEKSEVYRELWDDVTADLSLTEKKERKLNRMGITASVGYLIKNKKMESITGVGVKDINVDIVSTFDSTLPFDIDRSKFDTLKKQGIRSSLDLDLHDLQEKYAYYLGGLATKLEQFIKDGNVVDKDYIENLYAQKNLFIDIVNEMFAETGKYINIDNSRLEFVIDKENKHISMYDLSSGEKQLLYILMTVLMEEQKNYLLFMDEPEISLHVDWQEILIDNILKLNPNCQLLIATHAPSLLLGGWQNYVKNITDIKTA